MFGSYVREYRYRLGLTQEELAWLTKVSSRTIRDIETGRVSKPQAGTMRRLAGAFRLQGREREEFLQAATRTRSETHDDRAVVPGPPATAPRPFPRFQLPGGDLAFAGRRDQVTGLNARVFSDRDRPSALFITGPAGIGKTALALHWAGQAATHFPDGQLYIELRRPGTAGPGVSPAEVITAVLDRLEVATPLLADPARLAGLYHRALAGRRILIMLDSAQTGDQVRPLLPETPGALVLVTSRNRLTSLADLGRTCHLRLDPLSEADARQLLRQHIGDSRLIGEPDAAREIVRRCAGFPGTLKEVAARTDNAPDVPLADLVDGVPDRSGDAGVPGVDVSVTAEAAAGLLAASIADVRRSLGELVRVRLLTEPGYSRHLLPHLLGDVGAELAEIFDARQAMTGGRSPLTEHPG